MRCPATGLRTVDHDRARASAGNTPAALHDRIKGLLVVVWNTLAYGSRGDARHLAAPSLRVCRLSPATISHRPPTSITPSTPGRRAHIATATALREVTCPPRAAAVR